MCVNPAGRAAEERQPHTVQPNADTTGHICAGTGPAVSPSPGSCQRGARTFSGLRTIGVPTAAAVYRAYEARTSAEPCRRRTLETPRRTCHNRPPASSWIGFARAPSAPRALPVFHPAPTHTAHPRALLLRCAFRCEPPPASPPYILPSSDSGHWGQRRERAHARRKVLPPQQDERLVRPVVWRGVVRRCAVPAR